MPRDESTKESPSAPDPETGSGTNGSILVGVDFSDASAEAVAQSRTLAMTLGAGLDLVHVVEPRGGPDWRTDPEACQWLRALGLSTSAIAERTGLPWVELSRRAHARKPKLVVVGSHGRTGYQPVTLGSTASRLALVSPVPVLVVSPRRRQWSAQQSTFAAAR